MINLLPIVQIVPISEHNFDLRLKIIAIASRVLKNFRGPSLRNIMPLHNCVTTNRYNELYIVTSLMDDPLSAED